MDAWDNIKYSITKENIIIGGYQYQKRIFIFLKVYSNNFIILNLIIS